MVTKVKTASEIEAMRQGGRMLATVLQYLKDRLVPGMSTKDIAVMASEELQRLGGTPSFLGYQGFPDAICISVNDEVVHGIPRTDKTVDAGDIVGLDFGVTYNGMITDGAISVIAGGKAREPRHVELLRQTERAMMAGIETLRDNVRVGDIGAAIQEVLDKGRYGIVRDLVGHGVGHALHESPNIPNFGRANTGPWLKAGMTIAIEPMATLGQDGVFVGEDGWTIYTKDGSYAAHFEHTVLITDDSFEILTTLNK
jgi:methionyl aminopeptidase